MTSRVCIVETELYLSRAARLMNEVERERVVDLISANPEAGVVIPGTGGLRKIRIPLQGRGKRGGGRVVYWFYSVNIPIVLLLAFAKNVAGDMTTEERRKLTALGAVLLEQLGGKK